MDAIENLYYALGHLAYAVAKADGIVQQEEKQKLHEIVEEEARLNHPEMSTSEIIFSILEKDDMSLEMTYKWAMAELKKNSYYFKDDMKASFVKVLERVSEAFPGGDAEEQSVIERFKADIAKL